jgi:hypothetical protein
MTIKCKIHNRGPSRQLFFDAQGRETLVNVGETVDTELNEGTFKALKTAHFDDQNQGLDLVSAEVVDDDKKSDGENATELVSKTKTHEVVLNPDPNKPLNPDPTKPLNPDPNAPLVNPQAPPVTGAVNDGAGGGAGEGGAIPAGDSIDKLLAEADAKAITFAQLRSRAKALLGRDFPLGTSPKMDEIVDLLRAAQKKQKAAEKAAI